MAAAGSSSEQEQSSESEEMTGKGRKCQRVRSLGDGNKTRLLLRGDLVAADEGMPAMLMG
eukprot:406075-Pelagomonas_calceolata.AAC.1